MSFLLAAFCERMGRGILPLPVEGVQDFVLGIYRFTWKLFKHEDGPVLAGT